MRIIVAAIISLLVVPCVSMAQFESFQKEYKTKAFTQCYDVLSTSDGGYLLTGLEDIPNNPSSVVVPYLLKLDCNGDPQWKRKYAQTSGLNNLQHKLAAIDDSNYVLLSSGGVTGSFDILVTSFDINGNTNWINEYGGNGSDIPGNIIVLSDGNIAVTGVTNSFGVNAYSLYMDMYALKIDVNNGNVIWSRTLGAQGAQSRGYDLVENETGGITIAGMAFDAGNVATWATMISLDANGNVFDQRFFGLPNRNTLGLSISRSKDGGYILSGSSNFLGIDWFDNRQFPFVLKTDANRQVEWTRIIEGTPNASGLGGIAYTPVDNGDTIGVAIETYYYQNVTQDPTKRVLCLLNENNGALVNARQYNVEGGQFPIIKEDIDGGYIMSAMTDENNGSGPNDQWWIGPIVNKLDKNFNSGCNETDRTTVTTAHNIFITVDTTFSLTDTTGGFQIPITPGSDSIVFDYPDVETFCESKHVVTGEISTSDLPCGDTTGLFKVSISYPVFELIWDFGDGSVVNSGNVDSVQHGYSSPGAYQLEVMVNLCDTSFILRDTVQVLQDFPDTVIVPPYSFCESDSVQSLGAIIPNGVWSGTGIVDPNTGEFSSLTAGVGTHEIIYAVTSGACQGSDTASITVNPSPQISLGLDTIICENDSILLTAPDTLDSYSWSNGDTDNSTFILPGSISLRVEKNGCTNADTIVVTGVSEPELQIGADTNICEGESYEIVPTVNQVVEYTWNDGSTNSTLVVNEGGEYSLKVNIGGCESQDTVQVEVVPYPVLNIADTTICQDDTLLLNVFTDGATYEWQDGSQQSTYAALAGEYYSVLVSVKGCESDKEVFIDGTDCSQSLLVLPNVFSPNGDDVNDVLIPVANFAIQDMSTRILNRWGRVVYETNDEDINWDGTNSQGELPAGTYFVICVYQDVFGKEQTLQTTITLIRNN